MDRKNKISKNNQFLPVYVSFMLLWNLVIFITPILFANKVEVSESLFTFFSLFCHQIFERSLCMNESMQIGNCSLQDGFIHQFPVCTRDVAFYLAMLGGGVVMMFTRKGKEKEIPNPLFLLILISPMAIDGLTQLFGLRESTNEIRLVTGFLAGIAVPFYLIPILNKFSLRGAKNARD